MSRYNYLRKYASSDTWSPSTSPETVQQAQMAIHAIQNHHDVSATMLESVISLTYHVSSLLELLGDPELVQGCILYLCRREAGGVQVFDDEQGYLYFRILVLAINILVISKYDCPAFWRLLASMDGKQDASKTLSDGVEVFLAHRIDSHPDQVIGWSSSAPNEIIVNQECALLLLGLLFKNRKGLLRAWSETCSPTLTGLLFVLWRLAHITSTPALWIYFIDIAQRNYLVVGGNGASPIQKFEQDIRERAKIWLSRNTPVAVDLEDSRTQLALLGKQLQFERDVGFSAIPFSMFASSLILHFTPTHEEGFVPGVEDLFVPLIQKLFGGFWRYLAIDTTPRPVPPEVLVNHFGAMMVLTNCMLRHLINHPTAGVTAREALQATADLGVIEMMSQSIILIDDYNGEEIAEKK
ncbi:unnamed protein product [Rhizoctonia solani]|nr:unnamed protein product [Rhizoctonia solani]